VLPDKLKDENGVLQTVAGLKKGGNRGKLPQKTGGQGDGRGKVRLPTKV